MPVDGVLENRSLVRYTAVGFGLPLPTATPNRQLDGDIGFTGLRHSDRPPAEQIDTRISYLARRKENHR